jgi:hypothetical protein
MELLKNRYLRARLFGLAIVVSIAIIVELIVFFVFIDRPVLQVKILGMISLGLIGFLLHTSYQIWDWFNNPYRQNDITNGQLE